VQESFAGTEGSLHASLALNYSFYSITYYPQVLIQSIYYPQVLIQSIYYPQVLIQSFSNLAY